MKQAIIALDGGGSNLRMLVADRETEEELYYREIASGTNLSTVPNREEALNNIKRLIADGYTHMPEDYALAGIGLSSAGTEIVADKLALEQALKDSVEGIKKCSERAKQFSPQLFVTNDIDILLHSADIALVAGTGTVGAVKYKDIRPYDNYDSTDEMPEEYTIEKLDGAGPYIGDKGAGYWIAKEILTRVGEIETLGGYINSRGEFLEEYNSYLRELVLDKLCEEKCISPEVAEKAKWSSLREANGTDYVSVIYEATKVNGKPFDRAKVGNLFAKLADKAALQGDDVANDILLEAANELFKNIRAAYVKGNLDQKENCVLLLSGSVLTHSNIVRYFLDSKIREHCPNLTVRTNKEKPVQSTVKYVKSKLGTSKTLPDAPTGEEKDGTIR